MFIQITWWELSIILSTVLFTRQLALVLGDSHVYWLGGFVAEYILRFGSGPDFQGTDCCIRFSSFRGGTVASVGSLRRVTSLLTAEVPRVVVLALGGNDLDSATDHLLLVGMRVFELAKSVSRGVERVVTQVLRRHRFHHISIEEGPRRVLEINEFLAAVYVEALTLSKIKQHLPLLRPFYQLIKGGVKRLNNHSPNIRTYNLQHLSP